MTAALHNAARSILLGSLLLFTSVVSAQVYVWDTDLVTAGSQDGTGTWTAGQPNWRNESLLLDNQVWVDGNAAVFGSGSGSAGLVTLGGPIIVGGLTFNAATTGNYTLGGAQTLTLLNSAVTVNANATISTALAGNTAWTKSGTGQLTLSGAVANNQTGTLTVNQGRVELAKTGGMAALAGNLDITTGGLVTFVAGTTNQIVSTANVTLSGAASVFNGIGPNAEARQITQSLASLNLTGGTFNSGANSVWNIGSVSFAAGANKLFVGNSGSVQTFGSLSLVGMNGASSSVSVNNSFTLFGNGGIRTLLTIGAGGLSLDGSRLQLGSGTNGSALVLNGEVTTAGITGSTLERIAGTGVAPFIGLSGVAGTVERIFTIAGGGANLNVSPIISNGSATTGSLIKNGVGTLTFSGAEANTYTGTTTINAGTLTLSKTSGVNAVVGNVIVNTGGTLTLSTNQQIADGAGVVFNGGVLSAFTTTETVAFITQNSGGFQLSGNTGQLNVTGALTLAGGNQFTLNSSVSATPPNWTVGSAVLTGADIVLGANNGAGNPRTSLTIGSGGLTMQGRNITLNAGNAGAVLHLNGGFTGSGTNAINATGSGVQPLVQLVSTQSFNVLNGTTTISAEIAGAGGIVKVGSGLLQLTGANSYTGPTTVSGGTLSVAASAGRLNGTSSLAVNSGGILQNGSPTVASNNAVADRINPLASLTLGNSVGGGTFRLQSAAAGSHTQTLDSLIIGGVGNIVSVLANASTTATLTFSSANPYVRTTGSVNFVQNPAVGGSIVFTNAPSGAGNVVGGLLAGATLNGTDLIAAQSGVLTAFAGWVPTGTNTWNPGAAMDVTGTNPVAYPATNLSALRFNTAGPFTVTLSGNHAIQSDMLLVTPNAGAGVQSITGGELSGAAGSSLIVSQNNTIGSLSIGSTLVNNTSVSGLIKTGLGLLTLTGTNTYTGSTLVDQGVLRAVDGIGLPSASNLLLNGGAIEPTAATFTRALGSAAGEVRLTSGAGGFSAFGSALSVNLGGVGSTIQWGGTHFNPSALILNASTADNALEFVNGLDLNGVSREIRVDANVATMMGLISNSVVGSPAGFNKTGLGTLVLPTANTYDGPTVITAGTLAIGDNSSLGAGAIQLNGGTLRLDIATRTLTNPVTITGASSISGSQSLILNGTVTNSGGNQSLSTNLAGAAVLDINGNLYLSELTTVSRQLSIFGGGTRNINGVIANNAGDNALASHLFFNGGGLLNLNSVNTFTGRTLAAGGGYIVITQDRNLGATPSSVVVDSLILANNGRLRAAATFELSANRTIGIGNSGGGAATGQIDVVANQVFTVAGSIVNRTLNNDGTATLANTGALTKTGTGVLVLTGNNSFSGLTTVSNGILRLASNTALGSTAAGTLVANIGHVELANGVVVTGEAITLSGGGGVVGPGSPDANRGSLQASANATAEWAGDVIIGATNSRLGVQNGGTLLISGNITDNGNNHTVVFSGDLNGNASGSGAVIIAGTNNTWGGNTNIVRGTVKLGANNALPTATTLDIHFTNANNAEYAGLDLNGYNQTVGRLQNSGVTGANAVLTNSSRTLSTFTVNQSTLGTYAGVITGNLALAKSGAGVLILSQANSYTGGTVIHEGTIRITTGGALAQGDLTIHGGATAAGTLDLNNVTTAVVNGLSGSTGAITGLIVNDSPTNAVRTLTVGVNHASSTYAGRLIDNNGGLALGKVGLSKIGTGTLTLSGANTHTGGTNIVNGTLVADYSANNVLGTSQLNFQGGTLVIRNAGSVSVGSINLAQSGSDFSNNVLRIENGATVTTPSFTSNAFAPLLVDLTGGGTLIASSLVSSSVVNDILVGSSQRATLYVKDNGGVGFATRTASNEIVRYTSATALPALSSSTVNTANYIVSSDLTRTAVLNFNTLQIDASTADVTLSLGANNLVVGTPGRGILITGDNDATITATTGVLTNGSSIFIANHGLGETTIDIGLGNVATIINGPGLVNYTKTINPADLYVASGTFRMSGGDRDYNSGILRIYGDAVLEIGADLNAATNGDFTRSVAQTVGSVALIGNGGFSAHGADRVVALGGVGTTEALIWGANNFLAGPGGDNNYAFKLGSATSTHTLEFQNSVNLGNRQRIIEVADGTSTSNVDGRLTGVLSGVDGSLIKTGTGRLELTAANAYTGSTQVQAGSLQLASTGRTGTGAVAVSSGATLLGTGSVQGSSFTLASGAFLQAGNGTGTTDHGTLTFNPSTTGRYDLQSGSTISLSLNSATNQLMIDPTFGGHEIGSAGYNAYVDSFGGTGSGLHDLLSFNGAAGSTLKFSSNLTVVPDGFTAQSGQIFNLLDWTVLVNADFSGFDVGTAFRDGSGDDLSQFNLPQLTGGLFWDISRFTTSGVIVVVPEPTRAYLLWLGLTTLFLRRRRVE